MPPQEITFGGKFFDEMRLLLEETFRLDELKILCMELDVIPDNVPGDTLRAKIHGLLDEFRRIGRLPELVEYCLKRRQQIPYLVKAVRSNRPRII